jgi:hypothetical protein
MPKSGKLCRQGWDAGTGEGILGDSETREESFTRPFDLAYEPSFPSPSCDPFKLVAAVGDPMQIAAAGMAIAASRRCGVLLAGGTQMLAVYALAQALAKPGATGAKSAVGVGIVEQDSLIMATLHKS